VIQKTLFLWVFCCLGICVQGQNIEYARKVIDTLCSPELAGRGYVNNGHLKAAEYLSNEFKSIGLKSFDKNYFHTFLYTVNTFPGAMQLKLGETQLEAGKDFICHPSSGGIRGQYEVVHFNKKSAKSEKKLKKLLGKDHKGKFLVFDSRGITNEKVLEFFRAAELNPLHAQGIIIVKEKLTAGLSKIQFPHPVFFVLADALPVKFNSAEAAIDAKILERETSKNVIGYVEGTHQPDSFLVFSAHYDHLGHIGKDVYIPGANDNASGTSLVLNLAKHYRSNPHRYSVVFMLFGGEEIGLLGSKHYTEYPLFDLKKIRFLLNMDIMGTGDEGIKVVNATEFPKQFDQLVALNQKHDYLAKVGKRGKAANSDHYFFYKAGVPCFFIYTLGGIKAYHDVYDRAETLPLTEYEDVFRLMVEFAKRL